MLLKIFESKEECLNLNWPNGSVLLVRAFARGNRGLSCPTAQYIIELAKLFRVSSDYILGITNEQTVQLSGLTNEEKQIIQALVQYFDNNKNKSSC